MVLLVIECAEGGCIVVSFGDFPGVALGLAGGLYVSGCVVYAERNRADVFGCSFLRDVLPPFAEHDDNFQFVVDILGEAGVGDFLIIAERRGGLHEDEWLARDLVIELLCVVHIVATDTEYFHLRILHWIDHKGP